MLNKLIESALKTPGLVIVAILAITWLGIYKYQLQTVPGVTDVLSIANVPGLVDLSAEQSFGQPQIQVVGPIQINRVKNQRRWIVQGNVSDRDIGSVVADIQQRIADRVKIPEYIRIEMICADHMATTLVETIRTSARTGKRGDGKIFVSPVESALRIHDAQIDNNAI